MAVTAVGSGTQTAVIGTEHTLLDVSAAGTFQVSVDKAAMVAGDTLELRVYDKVLAGGTLRVLYKENWSGAQPADDMIAASIPASNDLTAEVGLRFTLRQTTGTGRAFPWKVLQFA